MRDDATPDAVEFRGVDDLGRDVGTHEAFWAEVAKKRSHGADGSKPTFYAKGIEYWDGVAPDVDGVLGGFAHVSAPDARDNAKLLEDLRGRGRGGAKANGTKTTALDCGAGVGRVTSTFLIEKFDEVDLVEPCRHFLDAAAADALVRGDGRADGHRAKRFVAEPLESFVPERERYDVIWIQWCIGHLTDDDFVAFLRRCKDGLRENGVIVMKENNAASGFILDLEDSSITRSHEYLLHIIKRTGMRCLEHRLQTGFPPELFAVRMYVIVP
jgi:protein N-terminal methyltransferase